jgi:hypothetical protein
MLNEAFFPWTAGLFADDAKAAGGLNPHWRSPASGFDSRSSGAI